MTKLTPRFIETHPQQGNGGGIYQGFQNLSAPIPMIMQPAVQAPITELPKKKGRPKKAQEQIVNIPQFTVPVVQQAPLKVALIGTAPSSRMLAPYNDPSWSIWACSPGNQGVIPRVDAWFEIHGTNLLWPENKHYGEPYLAWLKQQKFPVYMQDQSLVPNAISLPKEELVKEFGPYFFTSSFAWMMALAMMYGAKEIALFGIDMASRDEYILQRPGAYYFFCEAARRGVRITAPHESDIMQPPGLYGFSDIGPFGRKILARKSEINERLAGMRQQRDKLTHDITYLEGAIEDISYVHDIWEGVQDNSNPDYLEKLIQSSGPQTNGEIR